MPVYVYTISCVQYDYGEDDDEQNVGNSKIVKDRKKKNAKASSVSATDSKYAGRRISRREVNLDVDESDDDSAESNVFDDSDEVIQRSDNDVDSDDERAFANAINMKHDSFGEDHDNDSDDSDEDGENLDNATDDEDSQRHTASGDDNSKNDAFVQSQLEELELEERKAVEELKSDSTEDRSKGMHTCSQLAVSFVRNLNVFIEIECS